VDYAEFSSDLRPSRKFSFSAAEENEDTMRRLGVNQRVRQLGTGRFQADMAVRETAHADFFSDRFSRALAIALEPPARTVVLLFPRSASGRFLASGCDLANEAVLVLPDGCATDIVVPDLAGSEAVAISTDRFLELVDVLCPTFVPPERTTVLAGDAAGLGALRAGVLGLTTDAAAASDPEAARDVVVGTIAWLGDAASHPQVLRSNAARRRVAKLAREYIEARYSGAVRTDVLCRLTGVGARTLQRSFREYFGLTITDYVTTVRLNAAHRELAAAHPAEASVSGIALKHGFTHLGRFSVEFRARFGESPRHTLGAAIRRARHPSVDQAGP
jgi:AraC-like DNA-binding protein